jgi:hypothetical protein
MTISQETIAEFLQLGGQYALPIAALLRALYAGFRGKLPEGFVQIAGASIFAGVVTVIDPSQPFDWRVALLELTGNAVFMAGLLSFILLYLLRQPNRGLYFDGFVGGALGLVAWVVWTQILLNEWPWWTAPLAIAGGVAGFIALRFSLRQIAKLVRIATYFIVLGVILVIGAGFFLAANWFMTQVG